MITLDEHNAEKMENYPKVTSNKPVKNGISCPECEKELWDSSPKMTLASIPPKKNIHCDCGYEGYRIA